VTNDRQYHSEALLLQTLAGLLRKVRAIVALGAN